MVNEDTVKQRSVAVSEIYLTAAGKNLHAAELQIHLPPTHFVGHSGKGNNVHQYISILDPPSTEATEVYSNNKHLYEEVK